MALRRFLPVYWDPGSERGELRTRRVGRRADVSTILGLTDHQNSALTSDMRDFLHTGRVYTHLICVS